MNLRRAVSSAYYAAFHKVTLLTVAHLLPDVALEERYRFARNVQHSSVKDVCTWVMAKGKAPKHGRMLVEEIRANCEDIAIDVAQPYLDLYEARHQADYDHLANFDKATTLARVGDARVAIDTLSRLASQRDPYLSRFLALIAMKATFSNH